MRKHTVANRENWSLYDEQSVFQKLLTSPKGLSQENAQSRLEQYGFNELPSKPPTSILKVFLNQFKSPLIYILLTAGIVTIVMREYSDAVFIFGIIILNASLGTIQEWKAEKNAENLQKLLKLTVRVKRSDNIQEISSKELVPGDMVLLESGQKVPADIRLIHAHQLEVDESFLTGESDTIHKSSSFVSTVDMKFSEQKNMIFAGSTIMSGRCNGIVVHTGSHTVVGEIADSLVFEIGAKPPLVIRMNRFAKMISIFVLGAVIILSIVSALNGMSFHDIFFLSVALAVSAIPEGLPIAMTVTLSVASKRMAKRNVIIRNLVSVESLGSCTMIASDKTGTLTVNRQTLKKVVLPWNQSIEITGEGYEPNGEVLVPEDSVVHELIDQIAETGAACNEAILRKDDEKWSYQGDVIDIAFLTFSYKANRKFYSLQEELDIIGTIPFESEKMFAASEYNYQKSRKIAVKGAVEKVIEFCDKMINQNGVPVLINKQQIENQTLEMTQKGYRVLALAQQSNIPKEEELPLQKQYMTHMTFLGLACFMDPLKPESKDAIQKAKSAGIEVVMITGDHPSTAFTIAKELELADSLNQTITGKKLEEYEETLTPSDFMDKISQIKVFARVTPLQKLRIVETMLDAGHFIAVTGDGVNDAPALKKANIGVAMGSGSDVAKDAASIIIVDNNFSTIIKGIEEGRYAYSNVRKVIYLLISTGFAELVLFILSIIFQLPIPLLPIQVLWLNLVTNGIQDIALGFEAGETSEMQRRPRKTSERIMNELMVKQTLISGLTIGLLAFALWNYLLYIQMTNFQARNLILMLMVLLENIHVFNCRSERFSAFRIPMKNNYILVLGVFCAQAIHLLCMYIPVMRKILQIQPIPFYLWVGLLSVSFILLFMMEIFKKIRRFVVND